jgi:hypothetical protein
MPQHMKALVARGLMITLLAVSPVSAGLELPPPIAIDSFTCRQVLALDTEAQHRAIIYIGGVVDGRRQAVMFDPAASGNAIERMLTLCRATPERGAIDAFTAAWK